MKKYFKKYLSGKVKLIIIWNVVGLYFMVNKIYYNYMNNYNKYLKYIAKYNLFLGGNKINTMKDLFNLHFDNNWILTGSEAIKKYLEHFNINKFDFPTNDVDIFYVSANELSSRMIGSYKRKQERPERSMTFSNDESSID